MSIATQIVKDMNTAREQVIAMCGFEESELNQLQWEGAIQCLEKVLQSDAHGIAELPKTPAFWAWWREQWYRRDIAFIENLRFDSFFLKYTCALPGQSIRIMMDSQSALQAMYMMYHRISESNPLINSYSMEVSFHCLIKELASKK